MLHKPLHAARWGFTRGWRRCGSPQSVLLALAEHHAPYTPPDMVPMGILTAEQGHGFSGCFGTVL
jgi:hypothetical protein